MKRIVSLSKARSWDSAIPSFVHMACMGIWGHGKGFVAWEAMALDPRNPPRSTETILYSNGWNGSFHAPENFGGGVVARGRSGAQALARLRNAVSRLDRVDTSQIKFELRRLVRPGD